MGPAICSYGVITDDFTRFILAPQLPVPYTNVRNILFIVIPADVLASDGTRPLANAVNACKIRMFPCKIRDNLDIFIQLYVIDGIEIRKLFIQVYEIYGIEIWRSDSDKYIGVSYWWKT